MQETCNETQDETVPVEHFLTCVESDVRRSVLRATRAHCSHRRMSGCSYTCNPLQPRNCRSECTRSDEDLGVPGQRTNIRGFTSEKQHGQPYGNMTARRRRLMLARWRTSSAVFVAVGKGEKGSGCWYVGEVLVKSTHALASKTSFRRPGLMKCCSTRLLYAIATQVLQTAQANLSCER